MFKRPESDGLANGVDDEGVPIASCGARVRSAWSTGPTCTPVWSGCQP